MTIKRRIVVSLFVLSLPATAFADPKKEAVDAMNWGLQYCKDGLNPDRGVNEVKEYLEKFKKRLATAVEADPSIRTWTGVLRGMKVNEGIVKCEKELPAIIAKTESRLATEDRDGSLIRQCDAANHNSASDNAWPDYEKNKAEVIKANNGPLTGELAKQLARCEATHAARLEATEKFHKEIEEDRVKRRAEAEEEAKQEALKEKKFRATLKGDRLKYYDRNGAPKFDGDDIHTAKEWHWIRDRTSQYGVTKGCWYYMRFNGNKKVKEWQEGESCKW
jgi:hypothetical protein